MAPGFPPFLQLWRAYIVYFTRRAWPETATVPCLLLAAAVAPTPDVLSVTRPTTSHASWAAWG